MIRKYKKQPAPDPSAYELPLGKNCLAARCESKRIRSRRNAPFAQCLSERDILRCGTAAAYTVLPGKTYTVVFNGLYDIHVTCAHKDRPLLILTRIPMGEA